MYISTATNNTVCTSVNVLVTNVVERFEKQMRQMLAMMQSSQMLLVRLLLAAGAITTVASPDCAFIPGPIPASNDTKIIKVDCYGHDAAGLVDTTGNSIGLVVYLYNCITVPVGLFVNVSGKLSAVTVVSENSEELLNGTFEDLGNIAELRLEGFRNLRSLGSAVFRPLRSLERLLLVGFEIGRAHV